MPCVEASLDKRGTRNKFLNAAHSGSGGSQIFDARPCPSVFPSCGKRAIRPRAPQQAAIEMKRGKTPQIQKQRTGGAGRVQERGADCGAICGYSRICAVTHWNDSLGDGHPVRQQRLRPAGLHREATSRSCGTASPCGAGIVSRRALLLQRQKRQKRAHQARALPGSASASH